MHTTITGILGISVCGVHLFINFIAENDILVSEFIYVLLAYIVLF